MNCKCSNLNCAASTDPTALREMSYWLWICLPRRISCRSQLYLSVGIWKDQEVTNLICFWNYGSVKKASTWSLDLLILFGLERLKWRKLICLNSNKVLSELRKLLVGSGRLNKFWVWDKKRGNMTRFFKLFVGARKLNYIDSSFLLMLLSRVLLSSKNIHKIFLKNGKSRT